MTGFSAPQTESEKYSSAKYSAKNSLQKVHTLSWLEFQNCKPNETGAWV